MYKNLRKASSLWLLCTLASVDFNIAFAQEKVVSGKVTSAQDKSPLPGVNVVVKGSGKGISTDANGSYQLSINESDNVLVFSFIGYDPVEQTIGTRTKVDVVLRESSQQLSEVVVTALGFKESSDKLAATSSKIDAEAITASGEPNLINSLAGKASGVQINKNGSDPGAGSFIQIRGLSTITGNNQPLIIVDGVPLSNSSEGGSQGNVSQQSRLNDINPNDIASVQILKGASAAALWGSRAANGVIVISTKKGSGEKLSISFSSSYSFDEVNAFHARQNTFGQGAGGKYNPAGTNSWGDKIADRSGVADELNTTGAYFEAQDGTKHYPIVKKNSRETFNESNYNQVFRTGTAADNTLSVSGGTEKSTFYFSAGHLNQKGVFNGASDYKRTSFKLNTERKFNDVFRIAANSTMSRITSNRQGRGNNTSGAPVGLLRNAPDFDVSDYKGTYYASPSASPEFNRQRTYRSYLGASANPLIGSPLWALHEQKYTSSVNRFLNSVELGIKPVEWFELIARAGYDTYTDERLDYFPVNDLSNNGRGQFVDRLFKEAELNTDLIGRFVKDFGKHYALTYVIGFNVNDRRYLSDNLDVKNFIIPDAPANPSNATSANRTPTTVRSHIRNARFYNTAGLSAFNSVFVNVSLAAEAGSAFGKNAKNTFYYPSADIAWQFSNLPFLENSGLDFGKLRASFGVVGVQPLPYKTQTNYLAAAFSQGILGDNIAGSQYGNGAFLQSPEQGNDKLRPERKTEYEIGADLRLWHNKARFGFTYYQNKVDNLLIPVTLPASTGFVSKYTNAATLQNKGIEADLALDLIRTKDFNWSVNANVNRNRNKVTDLAGTSSLFLTGISGSIDVRAVEGQPVGVFWYGKYQRTEDGKLALDKNNFPQLASTSGIIGDPNPDWRGGLGTTLRYKKLTLDVLFETSQGGDFYEGTRAVMYNFGTHADVGKEVTLTQDVQNYTGKVFAAGTTVRGNLHDFGGGPVLLDEPYYTSIGGGFSDLKEHMISDGSWTRLRQLSLSYHLDSEKFRKVIPLQSIDFSVTGRNLFLWSKIKGIDPDTNLTGDPLARNMDWFNSPGTRSLILTLRLTY
ncbi:SusC/RagA family TonB-linked outer membrane protein [Dyadobacter chenhuakuii]|uniref:SusC/RagA family TonB-linked outer membrane protein n=1 Tax=Dyadobacter chenhuakuii TaxID=2909339 RepID=A0A9X1QD54_9BACT|nr:SusC/RagA family TonB-linked outer membrane protein [Dyadobacter chenhuakuii]MCF2498921.1 SusC/RagA family TonB-linked outer membrane protein [Dyadobacter chenhuakuii]